MASRSEIVARRRRQLDEVATLAAMYCDEGEFVTSPSEQTALETAEALVCAAEEGGVEALDAPVGLLQFGVAIAGGAHRGVVHLSLGVLYPEATPPLVELRFPSLPRHWTRKLLSVVQSCVQDAGYDDADDDSDEAAGEGGDAASACAAGDSRHVRASDEGSECCAQIIQAVSEALADLTSGSADASLSAAPAPRSTVALDAPVLGYRVLWFHHIKSSTKRRHIMVWAQELGLQGCCKPGYPGVVFVEGEDADCDEYVSRLRDLRWKAMALRAEDRVTVEWTPVDGTPAVEMAKARATALDASRRYKPHSDSGFDEFGESDMHMFGAQMRAAGLEEVFLGAVLKVRKV